MGALERIVAAASRIITRKGAKGQPSQASGLQAVAWDIYETVPEVGTYADWVSNAMSGARLFAGKRMPDGTVEPLPDESRASQLVQSIAGGMDGQSEMLGDFGTNLAVAGEGWLIIVPDPQADSFAKDRWVVLSTEEVSVQRGKIKAVIDGVDVEIPEYDPEGNQSADDPVAIRVWRASPRRKWQATSPVIRSITVLEELRLLNAAVAAIARSRITGRGVLLVPAGTRFPAAPGNEDADSLLDTFIEVASTAIREPESAAATVPIVLEVPGDLINGVKWLQFSSEFDALAIQLRDEAIRRFATGADVPAEVLLGLGDTNHWGAWALTAEALKMGAEPRLGLVCHALTDEWLRPVLEAEGDPDADNALVWYDTSGLRSSSNKSASALEAFKLGLVSDEAARRELGFTEADAPEEAPPAPSRPTDTTEEDLPVSETEMMPDSLDLAADASPSPWTGPKDDQGVAPDGYGALVAAVDGLVWAALAVAGQKLRQTPAVPRPARTAARELSAATVHVRHPVANYPDIDSWRLLDGAWDRVPEVAARHGVSPDMLRASLDGYTRTLLAYGEEHKFENVPGLLMQMKIAAARSQLGGPGD